MVEAELIVAGIQALIRVGKAANDSLIQYVREEKFLVPPLGAEKFSKLNLIRDVYIQNEELKRRISRPDDLGQYWSSPDDAPRKEPPESEEIIFLAALDARTRQLGWANGVPRDGARAVVGMRVLQQWKSDQLDPERPLEPLPRFLLSVADAALEVVGANPSLLGIGGNGEKLVGALAANLAILIPNDAREFGPQSQFADRLLRLFLRAGLQTLSDESDVVIPQRHLSQLTQNFLGPVIQALPRDFLAQQSWHDVANALTGPAARAAFETLAQDPEAFLGREFDPNNALGAVTKALFAETAKVGLGTVFSESGAIALYRAALGVVADRPELFAPRTGKADTDEIATSLIQSFAETLVKAPRPFNDDLGIQLAVAALGVFQEKGAAFLPQDQNWEKVASALVMSVANAVHDGLGRPDHDVLAQLFSRGQLVQFANVFIEAAAEHPEWIAGDRTELMAVIRAVASARKSDAGGLLSAGAWIEIAREVATEVAANPGRLFSVANGDGIGAGLIADLVAVAQADALGGRGSKGVLFGALLQAAIATALRAAASQSDAATAHRADLASLAKRLCEIARERPGQLGSAEWLALYRALIPRILGGEVVLGKNADELLAFLEQGASA